MRLWNSSDEQSRRMLNALESGTVLPIHRHMVSSETVVILRGKICGHFFDDAGKETETVVLDANGEPRCPSMWNRAGGIRLSAWKPGV